MRSSAPLVAEEDLAWDYELSPAERRIGYWLRQGCTNKEIAAHLGIQTYTVRNEVGVLLERTFTRNRVQLAVFLDRLEAARSLVTLPVH